MKKILQRKSQMTIQKQYLLWLVVSVFGILNFNIASAQSTARFVVNPSSINACSKNNFAISFFSGTGPSITIDLYLTIPIGTPTGTPLVINPLPDCNAPGTPALEIFNIKTNAYPSNPGGHIKLSNSGFISPDHYQYVFDKIIPSDPANVEITLYYELSLDCSLIPSNPSQLLFIDQTWNIPTNTSPLNLNIPFYFGHIVGQTNVAFDGNYNEPVDMIFNYENNGSVPIDMNCSFSDFPCQSTGTPIPLPYNASLAILSYAIGITGGSPPSPSSYTQITTQIFHIILPSNRVLYIKKAVTINGCTTPCNNNYVTFTYNCYTNPPNSNPDFCTTCQQVFKTFYSFNLENPTFTVERLLPATGDENDNSCPGDYLSWRIKIKNTSLKTTFTDANLSFTNGYFGLTNLSLIDQSSIQIISQHCSMPNCATISSTTANPGSVHCDASNGGPILSPVSTFGIHISEFAPGDDATLEFQTYRCCSDDAGLLNNPKTFNKWNIAARCTTKCGTPIDPTTNTANLYYPSGTTSGYISSNGVTPIDISQDLLFTPTVTSLTAPPGVSPQFGTIPTTFNIEMRNLLGDHFDNQLLGENPLLAQEMTGILKAKIHCETGLVVANQGLSTGVWLQSNSAILNPITYESINPINPATGHPDNCSDADYIFYFRLSDVISPNKPIDFLKGGLFIFNLLECCSATQPVVKYSVEFSLLTNENCFSFIPNQPGTPPTCSSACYLPLSSREGHISVHCPGCKAPGVIPENYTMTRTTFGYEDAQDDHIADNTTTIDPVTYSQKFHLRTERSVHGDEIVDRLIAKFQDGDPTFPGDPGYSYLMMNNQNIFLNNLQIKKTIPFSTLPAGNNMNLQILDYVLYIDDPTVGTCDHCSDFPKSRPNLTTVLKVQVNPTGLPVPYIEHIGDDYLYTFSLSELLSSSHPQGVTITTYTLPFTKFDVNQQYRLAVRYSVCGNIISTSFTPSLSDLMKESDIVCNMWFIGGTPLTLTNEQNIGPMPNSISELLLNNLSFPPPPSSTVNVVNQTNLGNAFKFYCENAECAHYFVSTSAVNQTQYDPKSYSTTCQKQIYTQAFNTFYNGTDIFPYEFKVPGLMPDQFSEIIPTGYHLSTVPNSTTINSQINLNGAPYFSAPQNFTMPLCSGSCLSSCATSTPYAYSFKLNSLGIPVNCLVAPIPASGTSPSFISGDEHSIFNLSLTLEPDACGPLGQSITPLACNSNITFNDINQYSSGHCQSTISTCGTPPLNYYSMDNILPGGYIHSISKPNPNLLVQASPSTTTAVSHTISWNIAISNLPTTGQAYSDAPHVFIQPPSTTFLSGWKLIINGVTTLPINGYFDVYPNFGVSSTPVQATLTADYTQCNNISSFDMHWGWDCAAFPISSTIPGSLCLYASTTLSVQDEPANIIVDRLNTQSPHNFTLCDNFEVRACFKSVYQGEILPQSISILSFPSNALLTINSIDIISCSNPNVKSSLLLNQNPLDPTNYFITSINLTDILITDGVLDLDECICIVINYTANCGFDGNIPEILLNAKTYCGDSRTAITNFPTMNLTATLCTDCSSFIKSINPAYSPYVTAGDPFQYDLTVCNYNNNPMNYDLWENLPSCFIPNPPITNPISVSNVPSLGCVTISIPGSFDNGCGGVATNNADLNPLPGSQLTSSVTVNVQDNCAASANYSFYNTTSTYINNLINGTCCVSIYNQIFDISGTLEIDDYLILSGCTLIMEPGSQIIVDTEKFIDLRDHSTISSCSQMWKGVLLLHDANIIMQSGSDIRDAEIGITTSDLNKVDLKDSRIIDCGKSIYSPPNAVLNTIRGTIANCTFGIYAATLAPPYYLQPPIGLLMGVELNDLTPYTFGDDNSNNNIFHNLNVGVLANHCTDLTVTNTTFDQIIYKTGTNELYNGLAISAINTGPIANFKFRPINTVGANTIYNCYKGIYANNTNCDVRNINMALVRGGAEVTNCGLFQTVSIVGCTINASSMGIYFHDNSGAQRIIASGNFININGFKHGRAIDMEENFSGNSANYIINDNEITIGGNGLFDGIRASGVNNPIITYNFIHQIASFASGSMSRAISLESGDKSTISCNYTSSTLGSSIGLFFLNNKNNSIVCNSNSGNNIGIRFNAQCNGTDLRGNSMSSNANYGLYLDNTASIGQQIHAGNLWFGAFGLDGGVNLNATLFGLYASKFIVHTYSSSYFPSLPSFDLIATGGAADWFSLPIGGGGAPYSCLNNQYCNALIINPNDNPADRLIAQDSVSTIDYEEESRYMARQYLYNKIKKNPTLINTDSIYAEFYSDNLGENIDKIYSVENKFSFQSYYDTVFVNLNSAIDSLYEVSKQNLQTLDSTQNVTPLSNYETLSMNIKNSFITLEAAKKNLLDARDQIVSGNLEEGLLSNARIVNDELPVNNTKFMNDIYYRYKEYGFESIRNDSAGIMDIAQQCPQAGGTAVSFARNFMRMFSDSIEYNDDIVCLSGGYFRVAKLPTTKINNQDIVIIPNPAKNEIKIIFNSIDKDGNCELQIHDMLGKFYMQDKIDCNLLTHIINISELPVGTYLVTVNRKDKISIQTKLVVIR